MSFLAPLEAACSWVLITIHSVLVTCGLSGEGGIAWALSIAAMVIVIRSALLPIGVWHARAQQRLSQLRPRVDALRKDPRISKRQRQEALAALFKQHRGSQFGAFLPMFVQAPVLFALFRLISSLGGEHPLGWFATHPALALSAASAPLWGAAISASLRNMGQSAPLSARLVIVGTIALTALVTYLSARHSVSAHLASAGDELVARVHGVMPFIAPIAMAAIAVAMPLGVILYWCSSAAFGYAQQRGIRRWLAATS